MARVAIVCRKCPAQGAFEGGFKSILPGTLGTILAKKFFSFLPPSPPTPSTHSDHVSGLAARGAALCDAANPPVIQKSVHRCQVALLHS